MRLIDADKLPKCDGYVLSAVKLAKAVENAPTIEAEPITLEKAIDYLHSIGWMQEHDRIMTEPKHGQWIKMSDADGVYYACSECGDELPRVVTSFNPQFDLFPKLKCIDKTTYCPNCGAKMDLDEVRNE